MSKRGFLGWALVVAVAALILVVILGTVQYIRPEYGIALIAILGMLILVGLLAVVAEEFSTMRLADATQALGLPEGSVRALLAIGLMLLVSIIVLFLYNDVSNGPSHGIYVPKATADAIVKSLPAEQVYAVSTPDSTGNVTVERRAQSQSGIDLAKQLTTLFGTLLASIVAFYFGAATAVGTKQTQVGPPVIDSIDVKHMLPGEEKTMTIAGHNLDLVGSVAATSKAATFNATGVRSNSTSVECTFSIPTEGIYTITVSDNQGRSSSLNDALDVSTTPAIRELTPAPINRVDGHGQDVTITGQRLDLVTAVTASFDSTRISGKIKTQTPTAIQCSFNVDKTHSAYTVEVVDTHGHTIIAPEKLIVS